MTCNNYVMLEKRNFWKLWHSLVWQANLFMSEDFKKLFRNGLQIPVKYHDIVIKIDD